MEKGGRFLLHWIGVLNEALRLVISECCVRNLASVGASLHQYLCNIGTSRWELRVGPITAWLDRIAGAAWEEPGSIACCTLTSADPALLGIKDLVGNAQCQNVVCGNGTAETLGKIIIPLCNWLFIMWAIEQPVHVWVPMCDTIQRVHEKVHEIHGSRHALLACELSLDGPSDHLPPGWKLRVNCCPGGPDTKV